MANHNLGATLPGVVAGADLSSSQFRAVKLDASGDVILCGAGEAPAGVLDNKPVLSEEATVQGPGALAKIVLGATVAAGAMVASDASGEAVTAIAGDFTLGQCSQGGDAGEVASVFLSFGGKA